MSIIPLKMKRHKTPHVVIDVGAEDICVPRVGLIEARPKHICERVLALDLAHLPEDRPGAQYLTDLAIEIGGKRLIYLMPMSRFEAVTGPTVQVDLSAIVTFTARYRASVAHNERLAACLTDRQFQE